MVTETPIPGPSDRLLHAGEPALHDGECLALLLQNGTCERSAGELALDLLGRFGGLGGLAEASCDELARVPGVGVERAAAIVAAFALARRMAALRLSPGMPLRSPVDVARFFRETTRGLGREAFAALLLDARHRVVGFAQISLGTLQNAPVHPREVFRPAVRAGAAAVVVVHNHPSGDAEPSQDDRLVTERLQKAGEILGIEVLDHLVVGADAFYSFAEERTRPLANRS